jgi:hypothetical protein
MKLYESQAFAANNLRLKRRLAMHDILTSFAEGNEDRIACRTFERVADALGFLPSDFYGDPKATRELDDALEMLRIWGALKDGGRERALAFAHAILAGHTDIPSAGF